MAAMIDWALYALVRLFFFTLARTPRSWAHRACRALATLVYHLDSKHRRIGLINLSIAFPERGEAWRRRILKGSFQRLGDLAVELSRLTRLDADDVQRRVDYEAGRGIENYLEASRLGRGVVFATAHISVWELLPLAHALHGHPLSFVVRPLDNPHLERWVSTIRNQGGNRTISKRLAMRTLLKTVRGGGDVGILMDQNVQSREAVFVRLFGRPAAVTPAPAALALKTGAPLVAGFIYPDGPQGRYRIRFYPLIEAASSGDRDRDLIETTAALSRRIEEMIREFPECWLWGHRRFSTQPEGWPNPYEAGQG